MIELKKGKKKRYETNQNVINNLVRKRWVIIPPITEPEIPNYDPTTHRIQFNIETNEYDIIELTQEEKDAIAKEELRVQAVEALNAGFLVEPEGFRLKLGTEDVNMFANMLTLINELEKNGLANDDTPQQIMDKDGNSQIVTVARFRQIIVEYGIYFQTLWVQKSL